MKAVFRQLPHNPPQILIFRWRDYLVDILEVRQAETLAASLAAAIHQAKEEK